MTDQILTAENLAVQTVSLRKRLLGTLSSPLAVLAGNGVGPLLARSLANTESVPLVSINPLLKADEIAHILRDSAASYLLCDAILMDVASAAIHSLAGNRPILLELEQSPLPDDSVLIFEGTTAPHHVDESKIGSTIIYTSGTTGRPKGCYRTAAQETARANELIETYSITQSDTQLLACPLAHSAPGIFSRAAHAVGARTVILPRFSAKMFFEYWHSYHCNFFFLVPTQYRRLLDALPGDWDIPSCTRAAIVAGSPLHIPLHNELVAWLGPKRLWQFYGSSETGTISIAEPGSGPEEGVGTIAPGVEVQVRDPLGDLCSVGTVGELFVRSKTVMSGYLPERRLVDPTGFISVGDLGFRDHCGGLHLVDRKHDTIISGGINVYPAEVEAALLAAKGVLACVVVGISDAHWGEKVVALVTCTNHSEKGLRQHCRGTLAAYKIPKEIHFLAHRDMPIGTSGKPLRRKAREIVLAFKNIPESIEVDG